MRGTGRTTRQIEGMQDGGLFIVHNRYMEGYAKEIAARAGRNIHVVQVADADNFIKGRRFPEFVIDHEVQAHSRISLSLYVHLLERTR